VPRKETLKENTPLLLPVAHDALTAQLIGLASFKAFEVVLMSLRVTGLLMWRI
jgi:hypothetical protein